jgi:hypothetical protein
VKQVRTEVRGAHHMEGDLMIRRMFVVTLLLAAVMFAIPVQAPAQMSPRSLDAYIAPTIADTASVLLQIPTAGRTLRIRTITLWYDNAANTNPVYAGIVTADAARTRQLWLGEAMATSGIKGISWLYINRKIPSTVAQAGVLLFISGAASDTLSATVEYELITDN